MLLKKIRECMNSKAFKPTIVVVVCVIVMLMLPNTFVNPTYEHYERYKARVVSVNNDTLNHAGVVVYGEQYCEVEILNGRYKGDIYSAMNLMTGSISEDKEYEVGDITLVSIGEDETDNSVYKVTMVDYYRTNYELILVLAFISLLIGLSGWIGVRAVLSFVFSVLCIWKVLIPLILRGFSPIICAAIITAILTAVIIVLVYGVDKRFLAATCGSLFGTILTAIISIIFMKLMKINGAVMDYSESLLYAGYDLDLTQIFIASVYLSSSGALMDIAVDITSAIYEVSLANPELSRKQLIKAGLNVGRAATGTMTTTLLLAYSGSYLAMFMVFVAQGTPLDYILNLNYISAEILNTIVGSFGLVTVVPFTAIASGTLLANKPTLLHH